MRGCELSCHTRLTASGNSVNHDRGNLQGQTRPQKLVQVIEKVGTANELVIWLPPVLACVGKDAAAWRS